MQESSATADLMPVAKIKYGFLTFLAGGVIVALAARAGITLDSVSAYMLAGTIFGTVGYFVPQKRRVQYENIMGYVNRVAELLVAMHPGLSQPEVAQRLQTPTAIARLIESSHAIADLERGRIVK